MAFLIYNGGSEPPEMVASARKGRVQTGLIRRTLMLFRKKQHGNAEGGMANYKKVKPLSVESMLFPDS